MSNILGNELSIHGRKWDSFHGGYFSDKSKSSVFIHNIFEAVKLSRPDVLVDLGGGTGFVLQQLIDGNMDQSIRLVNFDASQAQLGMIDNPRIQSVKGEISEFMRDGAGRPHERILLIMRSVLHYFGEKGLVPILKHLRSQVQKGEYFVHQTAVFNAKENADCINQLYKLMKTNKWYPLFEELENALNQSGWSVISSETCPPLPLESEDLAGRYNIDKSCMDEACRRLNGSHGKIKGVFESSGKGFTAYLPYRAYICQAV